MGKYMYLKTYLDNTKNFNSKQKLDYLKENQDKYFTTKNETFKMRDDLVDELKTIAKTIYSYTVKKSGESYFSGTILSYEKVHEVKKNFIHAIEENKGIYHQYPSIRNFLINSIEKGTIEQISCFYQNVNEYRENSIQDWIKLERSSSSVQVKNFANNLITFYETQPYDSLITFLYNSFLTGRDLFTSTLTNEYSFSQKDLEKGISISNATEFIQTINNYFVSQKSGVMFDQKIRYENLTDEELLNLETNSRSFLKRIQNSKPDKLSQEQKREKYLLSEVYVNRIKSESSGARYVSTPVITTLNSGEKLLEMYSIYKESISLDYVVKEISVNLKNPKCFNVQLSVIPVGLEELKTSIARIDQGYTSTGNEVGMHGNSNYLDPLNTSLHIHDYNEMSEIFMMYNKGKHDINTNFNTDVRISAVEAQEMICNMYQLDFMSERKLIRDMGLEDTIQKILDGTLNTNEEIKEDVKQKEMLQSNEILEKITFHPQDYQENDSSELDVEIYNTGADSNSDNISDGM